jgi:hypothetical protein
MIRRFKEISIENERMRSDKRRAAVKMANIMVREEPGVLSFGKGSKGFDNDLSSENLWVE